MKQKLIEQQNKTKTQKELREHKETITVWMNQHSEDVEIWDRINTNREREENEQQLRKDQLQNTDRWVWLRGCAREQTEERQHDDTERTQERGIHNRQHIFTVLLLGIDKYPNWSTCTWFDKN